MLFRQPGILLLLAILFLATACSFQIKNNTTTATSEQTPAPPPSSASPDDITESTTSSTTISTNRVAIEPELKDTQRKGTQGETREESTHADSVNQEPPVSPPAPSTGTTSAPATPAKESVTTVTPTPAKPLPIDTGRLEGRVQIIGKKNRKHKPSNVIITLKPLITSYDSPVKNRTHEVDMRNKTYTPVAQTILKGDRLQFNNHDDIKHNVFSSSGDNTFDLGTFEGGGVRTVALQHTGIVKVYCNIHPEMATFVMVADNSLHAISNNKGEFVIENIPTGEYALSLWHIRGELNTEVMIDTGINSLQELVIDASSYQRVVHKNKFGEEYEKKPALFEDEFY